MEYFKAGDFTNGKMNQIFKSAEKGPTHIDHKQLGTFLLQSTKQIADQETIDTRRGIMLLDMLDDYNFKYQSFYANCCMVDDDEGKDVSNIISYISSCMAVGEDTFDPFDTQSILVHSMEDVCAKPFLYELHYILNEYLIDVFALWTTESIPINVQQAVLDIKERNVRFKKNIAGIFKDEVYTTSLLFTGLHILIASNNLFQYHYDDDTKNDSFRVIFKHTPTLNNTKLQIDAFKSMVNDQLTVKKEIKE